jgi:hypothetical protein
VMDSAGILVHQAIDTTSSCTRNYWPLE